MCVCVCVCVHLPCRVGREDVGVRLQESRTYVDRRGLEELDPRAGQLPAHTGP